MVRWGWRVNNRCKRQHKEQPLQSTAHNQLVFAVWTHMYCGSNSAEDTHGPLGYHEIHPQRRTLTAPAEVGCRTYHLPCIIHLLCSSSLHLIFSSCVVSSVYKYRRECAREHANPSGMVEAQDKASTFRLNIPTTSCGRVGKDLPPEEQD